MSDHSKYLGHTTFLSIYKITDHDDLRAEADSQLVGPRTFNEAIILSTRLSVHTLDNDPSIDQAQTRQHTGYEVPGVITV